MSQRSYLVSTFIKFINHIAQPEDTILDVGCGTLCQTFHQCFGERYAGLDLPTCTSPKDYDGDVENLPFPDNSFDIVTAWSVLEHLTNPFIGLSEMVRVTRRAVLVSTDYTERDKNQSNNHLYCWTQKVFHQFLSKTNLRVKVWIESDILFGLIWKSFTEDSSEK